MMSPVGRIMHIHTMWQSSIAVSPAGIVGGNRRTQNKLTWTCKVSSGTLWGGASVFKFVYMISDGLLPSFCL